ncbi:hypothetical protein AWB65_06645 [Caballeronia humi]|uniref:Uncharacterized protein n=1 Tax=Caballeronia humi TaxID=326474 RepID=A0A158JGT5_9BURK|nr:hypothetical protein AWB65_06645 [Caballeronia humi]
MYFDFEAVRQLMEARFDFDLAKPSDLSQLESLIAAPYPDSSHTLPRAHASTWLATPDSLY